MQADRGRVIGFFSERIQFELNPRYALGLGLQTSELAASLLALASVYVVGKLLQRRLYWVTHFELNPLHSGAFKNHKFFARPLTRALRNSEVPSVMGRGLPSNST